MDSNTESEGYTNLDVTKKTVGYVNQTDVVYDEISTDGLNTRSNTSKNMAQTSTVDGRTSTRMCPWWLTLLVGILCVIISVVITALATYLVVTKSGEGNISHLVKLCLIAV